MRNKIWPYNTPGIPDELFVRGSMPMTKKEVRVISLAQGRIRPGSVLYDIGAGTGSFSVEAAILNNKGKVYAIEKEHEGVGLISVNAEKFGINNIEVVHGNAPEALAGLPVPDTVFLGGSGGNMAAILKAIHGILSPGGTFVANVIVLENMAIVLEYLKSRSYRNLEITQVSITKTVSVGPNSMLKGMNPVYVISAQKP